MPRGGARLGSGRKTDAEVAAVRSVIDAEVQPEDWKRIIRALVETACERGRPGVAAAQVLLSHRFGVPIPAQQPQDEVPEVNIIEVVRHDGPGNTSQ